MFRKVTDYFNVKFYFSNACSKSFEHTHTHTRTHIYIHIYIYIYIYILFPSNKKLLKNRGVVFYVSKHLVFSLSPLMKHFRM